MKIKIQHTAQQGDVLLKRISKIPAGKRTELGRGKLVLAEGETTGHYHGIEEPDSSLFSVDNRVILDLKKSATLTHQEHGPITLESGLWEVGRVQEYDYFSKMARQVID